MTSLFRFLFHTSKLSDVSCNGSHSVLCYVHLGPTN